MENENKKYDFIIVGAGSSGSVIANRLTENPKNSVLLLEAGKSEHLYARMPMSFGMFIDKPGVNWRYRSEPEPGTGNRNIPVPRGKMLGGSSSINGLVYVRGQRLDYDTWAQMGNTGWSWEDLSKIFLRMENYENNTSNERGDSGPLRISQVSDNNPLYETLIQAAESIGYPRSNDYNGPNQEGISRVQATMSKGRRMSTEYTYLRPAMKRKNLHIITEAMTQSIILEGNKCVGVFYKKNEKLFKLRVRSEVILAAGAINTPQLLELSGIGNPEILQKYNIKVNHSLPAVGENFQDHMMTRTQWKLKTNDVSYNHLGRGFNRIGQMLKYILTGRGLFSMPAASIIAFLKTKTELETPDVQIQFIPFSVENLEKRVFHNFPGMAVAGYQVRPQSTGSVHIRSPNPYDSPSIRFNFLSDPLDKQTLVETFKIMRRIVNAKPMDKYRKEELSPGELLQSDEEIEHFIREKSETGFHPSCTCKMGPGPNAVVNDKLKVHGIESLRIADASIFPKIISGNTNAACIMVGEKAADLIEKM